MKSNGMIRLAVIGSTSSGKTYLLRDIIESFSRLGYECKGELGTLYASPFEFCQKLESDRQVVQTPVVKCRATHEYRGEFSDKFNRSFRLGFLDIPGELFTPERMEKFYRIISGLSRLGKYFEYDTYARDGESSKVLRFIGPSGTEPYSDGYQTIVQAYTEGGYVVKKPLLPLPRRISGKELVLNFFDYDTDSVIEAIADAIPFLGKDSGVTRNEFVLTSLSKDLFYIIYALYATDVVLCDKLVMPSEVSDSTVSSGSDSPLIQLQRLYSTKDFKPGKKKYYMAFRGADALIKNRLGDLIENNMKIDHVYALIIYLLEYKLNGNNRYEADRNLHLGDIVHKYLEMQDVPYYVDKYLKDDYSIQPYYHQDYSSDYRTGSDLDKVLKNRISIAVREFERIRSDSASENEIFMAPNVFMTSSAIADENHGFEVSGNDLDNVRVMGGRCCSVSNRACFGTIQLAKSLMLRNGVRFEEDEQIDLIGRYIN